MSVLVAPHAPSRRGRRVTPAEATPFRLYEAVLAALFVVRINVSTAVDLPVSDLAALALIAIAAFRRPRRSLRPVTGYVYLCILLVAYLTVIALINDTDPVRRLTRFVILMVLAGFIASERIDLRSVLIGAGSGLALNTMLFYAGVAPNNYGGLLTGFLEDKNRAGLYFAVLPLLITLVVRPLWAKGVILGAGAIGLVLTDSRTSMAAFAAAAIWLLASRKLGPAFRAALALALYLAFSWVEDNLAEIGQYAARSGSDALRARIDAAAQIKVDGAPWYGLGVGEGHVTVAGVEWFFHNSYLVLLVEGGWVMLVAVIALFVVVGFHVGSPMPRSRDVIVVEAGTVAILLCATRLGEVFFTLPAFLLLGVGLALRLGPLPMSTSDGAGGASGSPSLAV